MISKNTILSLFNERGTLLQWLKKVEKLLTEKPLLTVPDNTPQSTELVAVDNTGMQVMLGVGSGLAIENKVLKTTGGSGGGGGTHLYKHSFPIDARSTLVLITTFSEPIDTSNPYNFNKSGILSIYLDGVEDSGNIVTTYFLDIYPFADELLGLLCYPDAPLEGEIGYSVKFKAVVVPFSGEDTVTPL